MEFKNKIRKQSNLCKFYLGLAALFQFTLVYHLLQINNLVCNKDYRVELTIIIFLIKININLQIFEDLHWKYLDCS